MLTIKTKPVHVEMDVHAEIKELGASMRNETRTPHPGYAVVREAVAALKRERARKRVGK